METRTNILFLVTLALIAASAIIVSAMPSTTVSIGSNSTAKGDSATVSLMIGDVTNLGAASVNLTFDASVVNVTGVSNSDFDSAPNLYTRGQGWVLLEGGQYEQGLTGTKKLCDVTIEAVGEPGETSYLNLIDIALEDFVAMQAITVDEVTNGTFTIEGGVPAPTIVSYTISNSTIEPPQTTAIDVEFSETVSYTIAIENVTDTIYDWTGNAKDPQAKVWDGTYESTGTDVPAGDYTVNVTGTNTTTGKSVTDKTRVISVIGPDEIAPITTVTVPPDTTPIPSGTILDETNTEVKLSFRRTDNSGGCGIDYTNYSKTSETGPWTKVNATTATGPDEANVSPSITEETFNLTVSDEGTTKIYYYSVDKSANVEHTKNLTVRIQPFELQYAKMPAGTTYISNITNDWNPANVGQDARMVFFGETAEIDGQTYDVSTITKPNGNTTMYTAADATTKNFTMKRVVTEGKLEGQEVEVNLTFDPAYVLYDYPLKRGKTWGTESNVTGAVSIAGIETTNSTTAVITGTVTEEVDRTVPYGTFHCLVVEINASLPDLPVSLKSTYWMNQTDDMPIIPKYASSVNGSDGISIQLAEGLELIDIPGAGANIEYSELEVTPTSGYTPLTITASATVKNNGSATENYNASFKIDGVIKKWSNGTLNAGDNTTVSFSHTFSTKGPYKVTIDGLEAKEITVTEKEEKPPRGGGGGGGGGGAADTDGDAYSDIQEIILGTDPEDPCDPDPNCVACLALTEAEQIQPKPTEKPTAAPTTPKPSVAPTTPTTPAPAEATPKPKPTPGFVAVFAIAGLLAVAYLIQRRRK